MLKITEDVEVSKEPIELPNWKGWAVDTIMYGDSERNVFKGKHGRRDAKRFIKWIQFVWGKQ